MCGLVERNAGNLFLKHIEIVGYDAIELFVSPVLSGASHS